MRVWFSLLLFIFSDAQPTSSDDAHFTTWWDPGGDASPRNATLIPGTSIPSLFHRSHKHTASALRRPNNDAGERRTKRNLDSCHAAGTNPQATTRYYDDSQVLSVMATKVLPALATRAPKVHDVFLRAWLRLLNDVQASQVSEHFSCSSSSSSSVDSSSSSDDNDGYALGNGEASRSDPVLSSLFVLKADLFRLAVVWLEGGWWLDADVVCLTPGLAAVFGDQSALRQEIENSVEVAVQAAAAAAAAAASVKATSVEQPSVQKEEEEEGVSSCLGDERRGSCVAAAEGADPHMVARPELSPSKDDSHEEQLSPTTPTTSRHLQPGCVWAWEGEVPPPTSSSSSSSSPSASSSSSPLNWAFGCEQHHPFLLTALETAALNINRWHASHQPARESRDFAAPVRTQIGVELTETGRNVDDDGDGNGGSGDGDAQKRKSKKKQATGNAAVSDAARGTSRGGARVKKKKKMATETVLVDVLHLTGPAMVEQALSAFAASAAAAAFVSRGVAAAAASADHTHAVAAGVVAVDLGRIRRQVFGERPEDSSTWDKVTAFIGGGDGQCRKSKEAGEADARGGSQTAPSSSSSSSSSSSCLLHSGDGRELLSSSNVVAVLPYCFFRSRGCAHLKSKYDDNVVFHHEFETSWRPSYWHNFFPS